MTYVRQKRQVGHNADPVGRPPPAHGRQVVATTSSREKPDTIVAVGGHPPTPQEDRTFRVPKLMAVRNEIALPIILLAK